MKQMIATLKLLLFVAASGASALAFAQSNQTPDVSPILDGDDLPFRISIHLDRDSCGNDFLLPNGLQGYAIGFYDSKWLLVDGRTNGLHGFEHNPNNFPPQAQNTSVYVVDPICKQVYSRSLNDPSSGLTQDQVDSLSVTSPQYDQVGNTLYVTGGYGFRHSLNDFTTFEFLSAIDIPGLMHWTMSREDGETAAQHIRQLSDPIFKITGGDMHKLSKNGPTLLTLGQDFEGAYLTGSGTQTYSEQIRRFHILDDGMDLSVEILPSKPLVPDPNLRRRDLNVVPALSRNHCGKLVPGLVAFSGVFTPSGGIWTVPVSITVDGTPTMPDPDAPGTFKQGMNNYVCPVLSMYSKRTGDMYMVLFGGISFGYFEDGVFKTDSEVPFINEVTTIKMDRKGHFSQYLMDAHYPEIRSTGSNPGNLLLFGANGTFIPAPGLDKYQFDHEVFNLDHFIRPAEIGYILGGIQSTLPNTNAMTDSAASPYIFKVFIEPKYDARLK